MSHILFHFQYTYYYIVKVLYPTLQTQWTSHAIERISSSKLDQNLFRMISCVTKCFLTSTPLGKIWSFSRRISSENVIRSAVSCVFGNITDEIHNGKFFLCGASFFSHQTKVWFCLPLPVFHTQKLVEVTWKEGVFWFLLL